MATQASPGDFFVGIKELIISAAATVAVVLGLFNSVFAELVLPLQAKAITISWVSLGALVVLLVLSTVAILLKGRTLALASSLLGAVLLALSFALYLPYMGELRTYVFEVTSMEGKQRFIKARAIVLPVVHGHDRCDLSLGPFDVGTLAVSIASSALIVQLVQPR